MAGEEDGKNPLEQSIEEIIHVPISSGHRSSDELIISFALIEKVYTQR